MGTDAVIKDLLTRLRLGRSMNLGEDAHFLVQLARVMATEEMPVSKQAKDWEEATQKRDELAQPGDAATQPREIVD